MDEDQLQVYNCSSVCGCFSHHGCFLRILAIVYSQKSHSPQVGLVEDAVERVDEVQCAHG